MCMNEKTKRERIEALEAEVAELRRAVTDLQLHRTSGYIAPTPWKWPGYPKPYIGDPPPYNTTWEWPPNTVVTDINAS